MLVKGGKFVYDGVWVLMVMVDLECDFVVVFKKMVNVYGVDDCW